jgi:hypothetical protein
VPVVINAPYRPQDLGLLPRASIVAAHHLEVKVALPLIGLFAGIAKGRPRKSAASRPQYTRACGSM